MEDLAFSIGSIEKVKLDVSFIGAFVKSCIMQVSDFSKVALSELKFYGNSTLLEGELILDDIIGCGASILDVFIARKLTADGKTITWIERGDRWEYDKNDYHWALLTLYFMLMTRDKATLNQDEKLPAIIEKNKPKGLSYNNMIEILTANDLEKMNHNWIFDIKISELGEVISNRLLKGIAGSRLFNAIINYEHKKNITPNHLRFIKKAKEKLSMDIYMELHSRGQPDEIKSMSLSRNLNNFLLENYDLEVLKRMKNDKAIFMIPKFQSGYQQYKAWDENTLDYLVTSLK